MTPRITLPESAYITHNLMEEVSASFVVPPRTSPDALADGVGVAVTPPVPLDAVGDGDALAAGVGEALGEGLGAGLADAVGEADGLALCAIT